MKITIDIVSHPRATEPASIVAEVTEGGLDVTLLVSGSLRTGPILRRISKAIDQVVENVNHEAVPLGTIQQTHLDWEGGNQ